MRQLKRFLTFEIILLSVWYAAQHKGTNRFAFTGRVFQSLKVVCLQELAIIYCVMDWH
jgi:hypothetical protein